jgi:DNA-binding SARP family transcriptional activator/tetratricopeptide (TPR) repeat protein
LSVSCLGRLEITLDGRPSDLPGTRIRAALTRLALSAGRPVPHDDLIEALWDEEPPADPRAGLHTVMTRLRTRLGAGLVVTRSIGYELVVDPDQVDALRFDRLLTEAAGPHEAALLDQALELWRGTPFAGTGSSWLERYEAPKWIERRLTAIERRADLAVAEGNEAGQLGLLLSLSAEYPLRESLWARLLVALDAAGRTAEALESYEQIRRRVADEFGSDPSPQLQEIHLRLLLREPPEAAPQPPVVPRQLPGIGGKLVGRELAVKALDELAGRDSGTRVAVIMGTAGAGKTALALHWAHRVAANYPDGQLAVNLRGFDPSGTPASTEAVIRGFLDALQVTPAAIPSTLDGQIALYRSLVADRSFLIVLDNARDTDQVRPLLPGTPSCLVLITSRHELEGLIANGAEPIVLGRLSIDGSRQLLVSRLGEERVAQDPEAADEIASHCSGLPLALTIAAARAVIHPALPLSAIAAELRDDTTRLYELSAGDSLTDVRTVFSWSYQALTPTAARLFRLFGLHPGPDLNATAVAVMLDRPLQYAAGVLRELQHAHLIEESSPGRFTLHDLLRVYAMEVAAEDPTPADRTAYERLLDHYLLTGTAAAERLDQFGYLEPLPRHPSVLVQEIRDEQAAYEWFDAERPVLLAITRTIAGRPADTAYVGQFADVLNHYLNYRGHWQEWHEVLDLAFAAALGDTAAELRVMRWLIFAEIRLGKLGEAKNWARRTVASAREIGDVVAEARGNWQLSDIHARLDRTEEALVFTRQAYDLFASIDHEHGVATTLNSLGYQLAVLGRYEEAAPYCEEALRRLERLDDISGIASTLDSLALIALGLGRPGDAITQYRRAAELSRRNGDRYYEGLVRDRLGDALAGVGRISEALPEWAGAVAILDDLGHPLAAAVREKLLATRHSS